MDRQERAIERENDKKERTAEYKPQLEAIDVLIKKDMKDEVTRVLNLEQENIDYRVGTIKKDMGLIYKLGNDLR